MKYDRIIELRKKSRISQGKMAEILGISQQAYSLYENGLRQIPDDIKFRLADYFDVSIDFLLGRKQEKKLTDIFPVSFEAFESGLNTRGITQADLEKLSPEQLKLIFDMLDQFIKSGKDS